VPSRDEVRRSLARMGAGGWESAERALADRVEDDVYEQRQIEALLRAAAPAGPPPGDTAVRRWIEANPDRVRAPAQVRLRQIVVHSAAMANTARRALAAGEPFSAVARRMSSDRTAEAAWYGRRDLPDELWEAVRDAPPGSVCGPVVSPHGYHLLLVERRRPAGPLPVREAMAVARRALVEDRRAAAIERLLERLRSRAEIRADMAAVAAL
jgi:parvulin-like peptidyl-prolyl isomerase